MLTEKTKKYIFKLLLKASKKPNFLSSLQLIAECMRELEKEGVLAEHKIILFFKEVNL